MTRKILIADDDYDNRTILTQVLEAAHYRVFQAANGQEAISMALTEKPDLIFMDLSMPKMNGWDAAKKIRQTPAVSNIPIFAFTAHALQGDETKALAAGCDDYVSKPCVPREVVEKVRSWFEVKSEVNLHG